MKIYNKIIYFCVLILMLSWLVLAGMALYFEQQKSMFELELKYKYLERNETINDKMPKV